MIIKVAGQEYRVSNRKSRSLGSLTDLTNIDSGEPPASNTSNSNSNINTNSDTQPIPNNNNEVSQQCKNKNPSTNCDDDTTTVPTTTTNNSTEASNNVGQVTSREVINNSNQSDNVNRNFSLSKSKSECNPFEHRKQGKIIRLTERPKAQGKSFVLLHSICICS